MDRYAGSQFKQKCESAPVLPLGSQPSLQGFCFQERAHFQVQSGYQNVERKKNQNIMIKALNK